MTTVQALVVAAVALLQFVLFAGVAVREKTARPVRLAGPIDRSVRGTWIAPAMALIVLFGPVQLVLIIGLLDDSTPPIGRVAIAAEVVLVLIWAAYLASVIRASRTLSNVPTMQFIGPRSLTDHERAIVRKVLDAVPAPCGSALVAQLSGTWVTGGITTLLDLGTSPRAHEAPCAQGPLPVSAYVEDASSNSVGEILVWIRDGRLIGLEYAWTTDAMPEEFPDPAQVKVEPT